MLCEKCQTKPVRVHIKEKAEGSTAEGAGRFIERHFCEDCGRDFIQSNPHLRTETWSKPEKRLVIETRERANRRKPS